MTDLTTAHLKHLLDRATPGPWEFHEEEEMEHVAGPEYPPMLTYLEHIVEDSDGKCLFGNSNDKFLEDYPGNLRLAALAPQLAQEVIRMRSELAAMKKAWLSVVNDLQRMTIEKDLAAQVLVHIDSILGETND